MASVKQDMPPPGGFKSVQFERVPLKKYWPASVKWLIYIGVSAVGWYIYHCERKRVNYEEIEKRAAYFSILPLLAAENDRVRLKLYRRVRDEEAALMKNVEGWKVGTYKGEPIYRSLKPNEWYEPCQLDLLVFADPNELNFPLNLLHLQ